MPTKEEAIKAQTATAIDTSTLIIKNDFNFRLRDDGDFECKLIPDFSDKKTISSFIAMMEHVKKEKAANPGKEIYLHYKDDAKIELHEYITPTAITHAINEGRKVSSNTNYQEIVERQKTNGGIAAKNTDNIVENEMHKGGFQRRVDGDYQCNNCNNPGFWTKGTVEDLAKIIINVRQEKNLNPRKKIFLHFDDVDKIELTNKTKPSHIIKNGKEEAADIYFDSLMEKHKEKQKAQGAAR